MHRYIIGYKNEIPNKVSKSKELLTIILFFFKVTLPLLVKKKYYEISTFAAKEVLMKTVA